MRHVYYSVVFLGCIILVFLIFPGVFCYRCLIYFQEIVHNLRFYMYALINYGNHVANYLFLIRVKMKIYLNVIFGGEVLSCEYLWGYSDFTVEALSRASTETFFLRNETF